MIRLRSLSAFTAAFVFLLGALSFAADKPNVILILADDLGYGDLGCFGQETLKTPRLDAMAKEGMRLTQFYAGCTVCAPSRSVLLTGKHMGRTTVRGNSTKPVVIEPGQANLASMMKAAGYHTACIGKWGVGTPDNLTNPNDIGFDHFFGYINMWHAHNFYPTFLVRNGAVEKLDNELAPKWKAFDDPKLPQAGRGVAVKRAQYAPDLFIEDALTYIREKKDDPFFLYLALNVPHTNNEAGNKGMEVPDHGEFANKDWPEPEKGFAAMIRNIDRDTGRILDLLAELGIDDNTLVMFTSDNGPHREGGHDPEFFNSNGPFRGIKRDLLEGGLRVPTIARWPKTIPAGSANDRVWYFGDFMASLAELAGTAAPPDIDSDSFLPELKGKVVEDRWQRDSTIYWEFLERGPAQAVRFGKWKAIRKPIFTGEIELYDMSNDGAEKNDRARHHPELVRKAVALLDQNHVHDPNWPVRQPTKRPAAKKKPSGKPNILWLSSEDNGPHLGCYGDPVATTPNLDKLAAKGMRYLRASSNAPVCAPARTTIISGIYPPSSGAEHMRSIVPMPAGTKTFPAYLAEAGYQCSNTSKEDYNVVKSPNTWVGKPKGKGFYWEFQQKEKPFFAVYNYTICHESQIRNKIAAKDRIHDPATVRVPAYHPDTPEVRKDWAQYHDRITMMDAMVGKALGALERSGQADNTIIFYWGDHGSGMPRSKRWPYNSGLHVPLIAYFPPKWQHLAPKEYKANGTSERMVGFIDFAPTMLSIAGVKPKKWMQGHAFAGEFEAESPDFSFGFRGRMDERVDMVRSVMDQRYVYLRQYGQYIGYMFITPTTRVWHDRFHAGQLNQAQSHFWQEKPAEELYDLKTDPDEVNNLVDSDSPEHRTVLERMRAAHRKHSAAIRDVGFLPESEIRRVRRGRTGHPNRRAGRQSGQAGGAARVRR